MAVINSLLVSNSRAQFYTAADFYDTLFEPRTDFVFALSVSLYDVSIVDALTKCLSEASHGTLIDSHSFIVTDKPMHNTSSDIRVLGERWFIYDLTPSTRDRIRQFCCF